MSSRVTQSMIARHAGVHRTTVSLALRNHPSIPVLTRERIRRIAESLAYRPDPALSALMAYRNALHPKPTTASVAYVTSWMSRHGWRQAAAHGDFFAGAQTRAEQLGYALEHFWLGDYLNSPRRLPQVLASRGIRGIVFASHMSPRLSIRPDDWHEFSVVKIDPRPVSLPCDYVTNDQRWILQTGSRRLLEAGYRRIGFVLARGWDDSADLTWSAGFLPLQQRLPAADRVPMLLYAEEEGDMADEAARRVPIELFGQWLARHRPDALLGFSAHVLPSLRALGLEAGRDIGFADILQTDRTGAIAGMRQNCRRVGAVAVDVLAHRLAYNETGFPETPVATLVQGTWIDGATVPRRVGANAMTPAAG